MKYQKMVKNTVKLGVATMAGGVILGSLSNVPGMPGQAKPVAGMAMGAMNLANVGNLANIGMNIMPKSKGRKIKW
jgi:hypothetical protein